MVVVGFIHYCYTVLQAPLQEAMRLCCGGGGSCRHSCLYFSQSTARIIAGGAREKRGCYTGAI